MGNIPSVEFVCETMAFTLARPTDGELQVQVEGDVQPKLALGPVGPTFHLRPLHLQQSTTVKISPGVTHVLRVMCVDTLGLKQSEVVTTLALGGHPPPTDMAAVARAGVKQVSLKPAKTILQDADYVIAVKLEVEVVPTATWEGENNFKLAVTGTTAYWITVWPWSMFLFAPGSPTSDSSKPQADGFPTTDGTGGPPQAG